MTVFNTKEKFINGEKNGNISNFPRLLLKEIWDQSNHYLLKMSFYILKKQDKLLTIWF